MKNQRYLLRSPGSSHACACCNTELAIGNQDITYIFP